MNYENIKKLREKTKMSMADCKRALEKFENLEDAEKYLVSTYSNIKTKEQNCGGIFSYIHPGSRIGSMVEVRCETDFVAKTPEFQKLGKELCLQIAAMRPLYITKEEISEEEILKRKTKIELYKTPISRMEQDVETKLGIWYNEVCLMEQVYVKDNKKNIKDLINELTAQVKESITIRQFVRWEI